MGPFDRFNDRAKRVLALAQDEAIRFNHNYIGPEHLLLGLVREGEGVAARVLERLGVNLGVVRNGVEATIGRGDATTAPSEISLHPRTKKIIELAIDEAKRLGHSHVGTEHLLLGMVREAGSVASQVLASLGVALEQVRQLTIDTLGGQGVATTGPHTAGEMPREVARDAQGRRRDWYCEDVLTGKIKVKIVWEDERVMAMEHPYPAYVLHGVVIPKKHVSGLLAPEAVDGELLASMLRGVQAIAHALRLDETGFQVQANAAGEGVTPHMHWHVVGPGLPPLMRRPGGEAGVAWAQRHIPPHAPTAEGKGPFSRFDESAKRVMALAQDEAIRLNHNYIGTEHLLAALVRAEDPVAARALAEMGVEISKVRTALEFIIGRGDKATTPTEITLSPRSKKVIELAVDEARLLGHQSVSAAHVLLGLVREGEGIASGVLESIGVNLQALRQKVIGLMGRKG